VLSIKAHAAGCYAIDIDPSGQRVALGGADTLVSLWDAVDYTCLHTVTRLDKPVRAVRFSKGGDFIATGSEENFIDISDAQTGECAVRLLAGAATDSLAWSPTEYIIAYVGDAQPANIDKYARTAVKIWGVPSTRMV
jgi:THO complex subunit 3